MLETQQRDPKGTDISELLSSVFNLKVEKSETFYKPNCPNLFQNIEPPKFAVSQTMYQTYYEGVINDNLT